MRKYRVHLLMHKASCMAIAFSIIFFSTDRAVKAAAPQSSNTALSSSQKLKPVPDKFIEKMAGKDADDLEENDDNGDPLESDLIGSSEENDERNDDEDEDNQELDQTIISLEHEEE